LDPIEIPIEDTIDLHSFLPGEVAVLVEEYVYLAQSKGYSEVRIIHGRGIGTQRQIVHSILRRHPQVLHFYDAPDRGSTSVILKNITGTNHGN
jgi:dsDNA-specific endonuclease/ATPase MutS2